MVKTLLVNWLSCVIFLLLAVFSDTVSNNCEYEMLKWFVVNIITLKKGWAGYRPTFSDFIDNLEQNQE